MTELRKSSRAHGIVALLPMKAHSERVPAKNFRPLAGKPLFRWILDTLLRLEEIDLVVINTDARDILSRAGLERDERVLIRDRKPELCGDHVSMNLILGDDIEHAPADTFLMTHTTNPLLGADTIRNAIATYRSGVSAGTADSLFAVTKRQTRYYRADGSAVNHDPSKLLRTQDLEPWFEENSCLYLFTAKSFASTRARIGRKPILYETSKVESVDIDDQDDWDIAEALARKRA